MARKANPRQATTVDAIQHNDKRSNIPTADAQVFVKPEIEEVRKVRLERDESLDPQLVWKGKYDASGAGSDLIADAPPIYIQEKIVPRVLIENLRRTAERPEDEPELSLFDSFDGLEELDDLDFYKHEANWSNRMILGDGLQVMASLAEREKLRGKVQMIYIDPPYGIKFGSNWQVSARNRDVKDGKIENVARDAEQIKAFRDIWELGIHSYLSYLRDRLSIARELLTESGSCFFQIGEDNVHLVRNLLDEVFGAENFNSQIAVVKTTGVMASAGRVNAQLDYILWYVKDARSARFHELFQARSDANDSSFSRLLLSDGSERAMSKSERDGSSPIPEGARRFRYADLLKPGPGARYDIEVHGKTYSAGNKWWGTPKESLEKLVAIGRVAPSGNFIYFRSFADDFPVQRITNLWTDSTYIGERTYVVQTPLKMIERCILMTTNPGDLVLDPTCGSGTTAYLAEQWGRRWITIDTSRVALALARQRLMAALYPWYLLSDTAEGFAKEQSLSGERLPRRSFQGDIRHGFVYEKVRHVTQSSIANNPDIAPGMSQKQIDEAIDRHSNSELLYDKPYEDPKKVRVAGPFTVESLSPHRSLAFAGGDDFGAQESGSEIGAAQDPDSPNFEQSILENLGAAGIQNGLRKERITFATALESYAGEYIQAIGDRAVANDEADAEGAQSPPVRIAIALGPQYGTVSASFVKAAAREALAIDGVELLCILGFAFDPQVSGSIEEDGVTIDASDERFANVESSRKLGRLPVLMVRMNADLLMGEELKKTGAGNLFTVFGEPDIAIGKTEQGYTVSIQGIDVYDPTTGERRSNDTRQIALWMIDTNYNGDSFFVRHCYFTGGGDPYKRLKVALKADIDAEAWSALNSDVSLPFPKPDTGKIAVKVINDYGDEVMKIFKI